MRQDPGGDYGAVTQSSFFFSSRRRHTRCLSDWSSDVCSSDLWGRGAIDMKGNGIAQLMAMIALKRSGVQLTRDIVFIGNSDEELGSTGAIIFVQRHPDLLRDVERSEERRVGKGCRCGRAGEQR